VRVVASDMLSSTSSVSAAVSAHVKPLPTFNTGSNSVLALSTAQPVKQPFTTAAATDGNVIGSFQFGAFKSQPLVTTVSLSSSSCAQQSTHSSSAATAAAAAGAGGACSTVESADALSAVSGITQPFSSVSSPTAVCADSSAPVTLTSSQQCSVFASKSLPKSKQAVDDASTDTALTSVTSHASSAAAEAVNAAVTRSKVSVTSSCSKAVSPSTLALAVTECDSRKSVEFSATFVSSSSAVTSTCALLTSHSAPLTQPASLFSFGQAVFAQNSNKPLGVPAASTLQFKAQLCTGL